MRDGFKVFDADAHVIYPHDLWARFLDKEHRDRVGRRAPAGFDHYNPVTVDGRWTQHPTVALRPVPEGDQLDHRGHDRQVRRGHRGRRASPATGSPDALDARGRRRRWSSTAPSTTCGWRGSTPSCRRPWPGPTTGGARRCARRRAGGSLTSGPVPLNDVARAVEEIQLRLRPPGHPLLLGPPRPVQPPQPRRPLLRPDLRAAPGPRLRLRHPRVHGPERADRRLGPLRHLHRVAHGRAPPRGPVGRAVDDLHGVLRAVPPPARAPTWRRGAGGCRRGCTASTSISSWPGRSSSPS